MSLEKPKLPAIISAHHASHSFGAYDSRVNLTPYQKYRYSDIHSGESAPEKVS